MPETKTYTDHGALWVRPDGDTHGGKIYGEAAMIERNAGKDPDSKHPDWHIRDPQAAPEAKPIGALWEQYGKRDGTLYLSGTITIAGQKRRVSLWPVDRKHDNSPHWRVLPPLDQAPPAETPPVETPAEAAPCSCGSDQCDGTACDGIPF